MSEWWSYRLSDFLMFSAPTWYRLLELHNADWLPLHALTTLVAAVLLWAVFSREHWAAGTGLLLCGLAWWFVGWAFHWERHTPINWGARYFAAGFFLQGTLLMGLVLARRHLSLQSAGIASQIGALLLLAAVLFPLLAPAWDRPFEQSEWFGLMPDPTVMATLGLLSCLRPAGSPWRQRTGRILLAAAMLLALLWCAVSGATLWALGASDWFVLPLAGVLAGGAAWLRPTAAVVRAREARPLR